MATESLPTCRLDDTVRIDLSLHDDSGIGEVEARFAHEETGDGRRGEYFQRGHYILLRGDGEGQTKATVTNENLIGA